MARRDCRSSATPEAKREIEQPSRACAAKCTTRPHFREDNVRRLHDFMRAHPLVTLVTHCAAGLEANEIPLLLVDAATYFEVTSRERTPFGGKRKRRRSLSSTANNTYISPSWYPSKQEHGKVVPTWNYSVVHAHGMLDVLQDKERLRDIVDRANAHARIEVPCNPGHQRRASGLHRWTP